MHIVNGKGETLARFPNSIEPRKLRPEFLTGKDLNKGDAYETLDQVYI